MVSLKEAVMNTAVETFETMQAEHKDWLASHAEWHRDIERWQAEHKAAADRLTAMQSMIREHGDALEEHARVLRQSEAAISLHEREIAKYQAGKEAAAQDVMANRHRDNEGVFSQQQDAHERIKKHHEEVMAQLRLLEIYAEAAM
jgi:hypothetical protein